MAVAEEVRHIHINPEEAGPRGKGFQEETFLITTFQVVEEGQGEWE
jgi:hypothetical protein